LQAVRYEVEGARYEAQVRETQVAPPARARNKAKSAGFAVSIVTCIMVPPITVGISYGYHR